MSSVLATAIGGLLASVVVFLATAVWKFARSVSKNSEEIANLAVAVQTQHSRLVKRIKRLEQSKASDHIELRNRIEKLERNGHAG